MLRQKNATESVGQTDANLSSARESGSRCALDPIRLAAAKRAFTTRRADLALARCLVTGRRPSAGDLVLARVLDLGLHGRLESPEGRRCALHEGDEIIVAYGARYAPDQFEAVVPPDLGPCDLAAGGGVAARVVHRHDRVSKPTRIAPVGLLADAHGGVLNLRRFALDDAPRPVCYPIVIAVAGTSMNAGKTTTASALVQGLRRAKLKVAAAKVTGTGSGGDLWSFHDAGAKRVLDFTDMGHAATASVDAQEIERVALGLIDHLAMEDVDLIVLEIADGVLQKETAQLLSSSRFNARLDGVIFAAGDAMGATAGVAWLEKYGLPVIAVSGLVSASPLAIRETETATGLPVLGIASLADAALAPKVCLSVARSENAVRQRA